ncbi:MAG: 5-formyltetrahydrofolate cyclo-ligase, partial [Chloroflexi bacterium]|nr:5-formyltetrahydrofolate cyclo-ligase [Chloroflexota bacterium]
DTGFGTKGPGSEARIVDPQIMLVPLSVFDRQGGRIGYGAGYYDQAIARLIDMGNTPKTIGMAFDCQQYDLVPQEPHDVAMDAIVTENGYREFRWS